MVSQRKAIGKAGRTAAQGEWHAQVKVVGRTRAKQGGGHDEGHNMAEGRPRSRAGWMALPEGKAEWNARAREGMAHHIRAEQDRTGQGTIGQNRAWAWHSRGKGRGRISTGQGSGRSSSRGKDSSSDRARAGQEQGWAGQG